MSARLPLRVCNSCGTKAWWRAQLTKFVPNASSRYGRRQLCGRCFRAQHKAWRKKYDAERVQPVVDFIAAARAAGSCARCGSSGRDKKLHFHHRDPATKAFTIGSNAARRSLGAVVAEMAKCDLVCHRCHMAIHSERRAEGNRRLRERVQAQDQERLREWQQAGQV